MDPQIIITFETNVVQIVLEKPKNLHNVDKKGRLLLHMNRKSFIKGTALCGIALHAMLRNSLAATKATEKSMGVSLDKVQRVFEVGKPSRVVIIPTEEVMKKINSAKRVTVKCHGDNFGLGHDQPGMPKNSSGKEFPKDWKIRKEDKPYKSNKEIPFKIEDGKIIIEDLVFKREDGYAFVVKVYAPQRESFLFTVYAVDPSIRKLRPLKGDTHIHSTVSDGKNTPEEVGARSLETGCDFQSLSDHRKYDGSLKLQSAFDGLPISIKILNAEECHMSDVHVHSLFADRGVTPWIIANKDEFDEMCKKIYKELPEDLDEYSRKHVAITEAEFAVIQRFGGLAGFDHPYWRHRCDSSKNSIMKYLPFSILDTILKRKKYDYVEVANGCAQESTDLIVSTLSDLRAEGIDAPIVGNSDAHTVKGQGKVFSIMFSEKPEVSYLKDAILGHKTVVVDSASDLELKRPMLIGKRRFILYAYFLLGSYFPRHEALCAAEAKILKQIIKEGRKPELMEKLAKASKAVKEHRAAFFGMADDF